MSATYQRAEIVVECGMDCGWTTEVPWSNRPDGHPGREGEDPPEPGEVFEGPLTCPDCEENGVHHSDLYPVKEVRNLRSVATDTDRSPLPDTGVAATGYVCQNFPEHPGEEPKMVSAGPGEGGRICPECGRMTGAPDDEIPYGDPPYDGSGLSTTESERSGGGR